MLNLTFPIAKIKNGEEYVLLLMYKYVLLNMYKFVKLGEHNSTFLLSRSFVSIGNNVDTQKADPSQNEPIHSMGETRKVFKKQERNFTNP